MKTATTNVDVKGALQKKLAENNLKFNFEVPEATNVMIFENCTGFYFYEPAIIIVPQNKIFVEACHKVITREPIMTYLEKQTKSPPL